MKRKYLFAVGTITIIGAVVIFTLMQIRSVRSGPQASTSTPSGWPDYPQFNPTNGYVPPLMPSVVPPKVTDLSPELPQNEKVGILVRHADGTREEYMMASDGADTFISNLPKEDTLLNVISPIGSGGYAVPTFVEMSPTPKVTDLLPDVDDSEKATLFVRHMDGSEEIFLIAPDRVDLFIHLLPTEDTVLQVISPRATDGMPEATLFTPEPK